MQRCARRCPRRARLFDRAVDGPRLRPVQACTEGPADKLDSTEHSQPALFVASLAALEATETGFAGGGRELCAATAGLSLGEYTALVFAGVMDFETACASCRSAAGRCRTRPMPTSSGMVSVLGLDREQVEALCDEARGDEMLQIANLLCPGNIVVSGHKAACERIADAGARPPAQ